MVEVNATTPLIGGDGPVPLLDVIAGRSQLVAYLQMWHTGKPAARQCEGCTFSTSHMTELSYLNSRDVSYATFCEGPFEERSRYRDFMGRALGGLASGLAAALGFARRPVHAGRPPDVTVVADPGRAR